MVREWSSYWVGAMAAILLTNRPGLISTKRHEPPTFAGLQARVERVVMPSLQDTLRTHTLAGEEQDATRGRAVGVIALVGAAAGSTNFFVKEALRPGLPTASYALVMLGLLLVGASALIARKLPSWWVQAMVLLSMPIFVIVCWTMRDPGQFASPTMMLFGAVGAALFLGWRGLLVQSLLIILGVTYTLSISWTTSTAGLVAQIFVHSVILLTTALGLFVLRRRLERLLVEARYASRIDQLTHVANRHGLQFGVRALVQDAAERGCHLGVVVLDLDHFKSINDTHGHVVGDQVLVAVANALVELKGNDGLVARIGGEEFVIIRPVADAKEAYAFGHRVCAQVRAIKDPVPVTGSIGVSTSPAPGVESATDWLWNRISRADEAMYAAKGAGRNRVYMARSEDAEITDATEPDHWMI